ncbi:MAG TPA: hypothetical protein VL992_20935, partial [Tepidisphaeraceae bacterium]|nr:hypothetical protein [Tepidisphaeraceae bacterium]
MSDSVNAATPEISRSTGRVGEAFQVLSWAIFLGVSWTWCIGMYLPVILVRDYGIWAFVVFAVPNVVGAAAMAWVLPDAEASREMVTRHRAACECFSIITVAFHLFFYLAWIEFFFYWTPVGLPNFLGMLFALAVLVGGLRAGNRLAALVVMMGSCAAITKLVSAGAISFSLPNYPSTSVANLVPLAMVCTFGFLLCPYLDLTFHEARQATTPDGG